MNEDAIFEPTSSPAEGPSSHATLRQRVLLKPGRDEGRLKLEISETLPLPGFGQPPLRNEELVRNPGSTVRSGFLIGTGNFRQLSPFLIEMPTVTNLLSNHFCFEQQQQQTQLVRYYI